MSKGITAVALAALMLLVVALPASAITTVKSVEVRGTVSQLSSTANFTVSSWNAASFAGFWYDLKENQSTESLKVLAFQDNRTIEKEKLWYNTTMAPIRFKVYKEKTRLVEYGLNDSASYAATSTGGGYYNVTGWFAAKYVAINGKNNKLAKLVYEQDTADKKTMAIGETWDLGEGYTLTAQSIDAKASPRQAWLVLNKDGNKLDDKIIEAASSTGTGTQGVYTY
ncbi:MAG TPA: S-layer protein domain-containing protein, partial [Candidatus Methanoperedens sp.]